MKEGRFAFLYDLFFQPLLGRVQRKIAEMATLYNCINIVDMGCGTGMQCLLLGRKGIHAVGIDRNPSMLAQAKKKGVVCLLGDITRLPFPPSIFDCAIISFVSHMSDDDAMNRIVSEARRVVKKGGGMIIADYGEPMGKKGRILSFFVKKIERMAGGEHYASYKNYEKSRYMEGLIKKFGMPVRERASFYHGNVEVVMFEND